ncbi:MAG: zf-CGNR multi-domain protein, partial [Microbacteriaceae bacterium]|nr:zf-CGNR multi-domain protein [Microbacteriaceae bacterium]
MQATKATGQWFRSGEDHRWWFDSGAVSLDFAYSGAMGDNPAWELLHSPSDLGAWLEARFPAVHGEVTDGELIDALALRSAIARSAMAASREQAPAPADVDVINLFAATPDIPPSLAGGTRQAGRARARAGQALSAMAREAVVLFAADQQERIRQCAADDCGLVFYDESRSNNRRWCSMKRCGNRAKVRTHRANAR